MTTNETRTPLPDDWEARRARGRAWAWGGSEPPSITTVLASLPQIGSHRVADEIVRELAGRGLEIREVGK